MMRLSVADSLSNQTGLVAVVRVPSMTPGAMGSDTTIMFGDSSAAKRLY